MVPALLHFEPPPLSRIVMPLNVVNDISPGLSSSPVVL
jgi:hypothetical protein